MKNGLLIIGITAFLAACNNTNKAENTISDEPKKSEQLGSLEDRIKRHIESSLTIPATEHYTYKIYKENLDGDAKQDAIISVNRLEFAMNEASKSKNPAKQAEIGFMGNHNYIFYYDGGLDQLSPYIPIPSSPNAALKIQFENITSSSYKDILIDFRIVNGCFRDFLTVVNHTPQQIFQWKVFDGINKPKTEAYSFKFEQGKLSDSKDILVLKANFKQDQKVENIYAYEPKIEESNDLLYRFFFYPKEGKYITMKE